ncbi:MAG: SDR family oxidoreductase [Deltaproteobacteria bacterium]|nr:SDR family oxidoreductase [Deltaproteobacteria bacterium]
MKNAVVIVTGASRGIGYAIVERCLKEGCQVLAVSRKPEGLNQLKSPNLHFWEVDVSKRDQIQSFFEGLDQKKIIASHLVNNAGIYFGRPLSVYTDEAIDDVLNTNLKGVIYFTQYFSERLMKQKKRGAIVNISSVSGICGSSDPIYGASKAAVNGFTKSCVYNFSPWIRVNAIAPGVVNTDMIKAIPEHILKKYRSSEFIDSSTEPKDIADATLFLLSEQSQHMTGVILDVNNGCYFRS